jgi:carboxylesterase
MPQIISTTEPFFFSGNKIGCLLIHGFTSTPKEMRWMGEYLNREHGFTCLGVRLTGHATRPKDMVRSRWSDWTVSVEDGYQLLSGVTDRIYLVGLSMGGSLSLLMSTRLDVKGVVTMSAPYQLPNEHPAWQIKILSYFRAYLPKSKEQPDASWFDKDAFKSHISYPLNPIRSAAELKILLDRMRSALPRIQSPVLLMHSKDDKYVLPENMEHIYAALKIEDKTKLYLTGSGHIIPRDAARESAFKAAAEFIQRVEGNK